jgi:hypothetical protein
MAHPTPPAEEADLLVAVIDLIGRTQAKDVSVRWHDEEQPTVWIVCASWTQTVEGEPGRYYEAAGGMTPARAGMRLLDLVVKACGHCGRPAAVTAEWRDDLPLADQRCWLVYDPETKGFRRSCEGETRGRAFGRDPRTGEVVGRNDPCPCGSGAKWKRCHGA